MTYKEMVQQGFKENKKETEIRKELRKEKKSWDNHYKIAQRQFKGDNPVAKEIKKLKDKDFKLALRILNPTKESLKIRNKLKQPKYYRNTVLKSKWDPLQKSELHYAETKNIYFSKKQQQKVKTFKKEFNRNVRNLDRRFGRYGKTTDISKITINFNGKQTSISSLYDTYLKTGNKYLKTSITKSLNKTFKTIKKIKPKDLKEINRRNINFDIDELANSGNIIETLNKFWNKVTIDLNSNEFGWNINYSAPRFVMDFEWITKGNDIIIHAEHIEELELEEIDMEHEITKQTIAKFLSLE